LITFKGTLALFAEKAGFFGNPLRYQNCTFFCVQKLFFRTFEKGMKILQIMQSEGSAKPLKKAD
jgi:hypothetical protein